LVSACGAGSDDVADAADTVTAETALDVAGKPDATPPLAPVITGLAQVVPSPGLPAEVIVQPSANNLDLAEHEGRLFLAFRTAPNHFANADAHIYVVSTVDEQTWDFEADFTLGTDLREPRLLAWDGRLFLYFALLGSNPMAFEPQGIRVTERTGAGLWTEPQPAWQDEFILWRARVLDGTPHLFGYRGGADLYSGELATIEVHLLTTADGVTLAPLVPGRPAVLTGGVSETDAAYAPDGALIAVSRVEGADGKGFGSRICRAEAGALGDWTCVSDPKKYDSPLVFADRGRVLLIGRRNVTETGEYDLQQTDLPLQKQWLDNELAYWETPKRCALWQVDPATLQVTWLLDLPSLGDTCFASVVPRGLGRYVVYNYSSPLDGDPDISWRDGQLGETRIYRMDLELDGAN
jgi:hypothetical protein